MKITEKNLKEMIIHGRKNFNVEDWEIEIPKWILEVHKDKRTHLFSLFTEDEINDAMDNVCDVFVWDVLMEALICKINKMSDEMNK